METVAVIFGGRSTEHDVSIITAIRSIIKPLELTKHFRVEAVYVSKDGSWYWDEKLKDITLYTSGDITGFLNKHHTLNVQFDGGLTFFKTSGITGRKTTQKIDIVFPSMHGTHGEDGALMGVLDMANVPYVGCGVRASAIAMDKVLAKQVVQANGLPVVPFVYFTKDQVDTEPLKCLKIITEKLHYPLFIKPAHLGSSIGISHASNDKELQNGLEVAVHYDDKVIVEEAVHNLIEVTLPIMGNNEPKPALLEQPLTSSEDFFDFDTKYIGGKKGGSKKGGVKGAQGYSQIPAKLPKQLEKQAFDLGLAVYRALECSGIARIDMLIDEKTGVVYFNEANPLPGSLYAHNWNRAGVSNVELVSELIRYGKERFAIEQQLNTTFKTSFLQQF
jgi:D-alanine-D-alanine ligase